MLECDDDGVEHEYEAMIAVADGVVIYPAVLRGLCVPDTRFPFGDPRNAPRR